MSLNPFYYLGKLDRRLMTWTDMLVLFIWNRFELNKTNLRLYAVAIWLATATMVTLAPPHPQYWVLPITAILALLETGLYFREKRGDKRRLNAQRLAERFGMMGVFQRYLGFLLLATSSHGGFNVVYVAEFTAFITQSWLYYALFPTRPPYKKRQEARIPALARAVRT